MINDFDITDIKKAFADAIRGLGVSEHVWNNRPKATDDSIDDFAVVKVTGGVSDKYAFGQCRVSLYLFARDVKEMKRKVKLANQLFDDVDALLNTHPAFMLGPWIENARAWGTTEEEKDYYERQARTLLTIWGGPILNDYANRMWGGLVKDYYAHRWNLFFDAVIKAVKEGKEFDEKAFGEELSKFEYNWTLSHTKYPVEPQPIKWKEIGVTSSQHLSYRVTCNIYDRWMKP